MKPNYRNLFMNELTRDRVVPIISASGAGIEAAGAYPDDLNGHFVKEGILRAVVPDDCGGLGLGFLGRTVLIEEVARVSAAVSMIPQVNELGCTPLSIAGTPEQRQMFAAPVARGELFTSYGLTEPNI